MTRSAWLAAFILASGCAGAPPPASQGPKLTVVEAPKPAAEKAPPPEPRPLPVVAMALTMYAHYADAHVGSVRARPLDEKSIANELAPPWKGRFEAALAATAQLEKAAGPMREAHYATLGCMEQCDAAAAKYDKLRAAFDKRADLIRRAHEKTVTAFEKQLEKAPSVALALAVARLQIEDSRQSDIASMNQPADYGFDYGEFSPGWEAGGSSLAIPALERAKELSDASTELGRVARYALLVQRWAAADADGALGELTPLLASAPADQRYELHARHGLLLGKRGEHRQAAEAFARALAEPELKDEPVKRSDLRSARVVAEYRAGRFREALSLALAELDRTATQHPVFTTRRSPELRLASDAVERLGVDVESVQAKPETQARVQSELALRALHRHDPKRAAELALRAIALAPKHAKDGYSVLIALAKQKGDTERVRELEEQERRAAPSSCMIGLLSALGTRDLSPEHDERNALKDDAKADGKRNVASLFRLCLEASFWRLPERGGKQAVELEATLKDDGSVTLEVSGDAPGDVAECLRSMGPKILARAPSSIKARVELGTARQTWGGMDGVLGGLAGSSIGEAFGAGGLGLRGTGGGGGTGEGTIGIGSFGLRGQGAGAGAGYGRGAKPPKAKAPKKK